MVGIVKFLLKSSIFLSLPVLTKRPYPYVDKILVLNESKGGVASAWMLYEMCARKMAPKAILFNKANTILAQGASLANLTICDRFIDGDITSLLSSGQRVTVDPINGLVSIL